MRTQSQDSEESNEDRTLTNIGVESVLAIHHATVGGIHIDIHGDTCRHVHTHVDLCISHRRK